MNIDHLDQLADAAFGNTEQPWHAWSGGGTEPGVFYSVYMGEGYGSPLAHCDEETCDFIAAANPQTVKALLAVARAAREWLKSEHFDHVGLGRLSAAVRELEAL